MTRRFVQSVNDQAVGVGVIRGVEPEQQLVKVATQTLKVSITCFFNWIILSSAMNVLLVHLCRWKINRLLMMNLWNLWVEKCLNYHLQSQVLQWYYLLDFKVLERPQFVLSLPFIWRSWYNINSRMLFHIIIFKWLQNKVVLIEIVECRGRVACWLPVMYTDLLPLTNLRYWVNR